VSASKTKESPKKTAKGKGKAVDSDVDDVDPETDEEGLIAPSRRRPSIRQRILANNRNCFKQQQAAKSKRDRLAALAAEGPSPDEDMEQNKSTKPKKEPASKKSIPKKEAPAATKSSKSSTVQNGSIVKSSKAKAQP
jgi:hypothetical protein